MKRVILVCAATLLFVTASDARSPQRNLWTVKLVNSQTMSKVLPADLRGDSLAIYWNEKLIWIPAESITEIQVLRKPRILGRVAGAVLGTVVGARVGMERGFLSGSKKDDAEEAFFGAIGGTIEGAIYGGAAGLIGGFVAGWVIDRSVGVGGKTYDLSQMNVSTKLATINIILTE